MRPHVLLCLLALTACLFALPATAVEERRITVNDREVIVVEPDGAATARLPLLVILHGGLGNAANIRFNLRMDRMAAEAGVRLAFVQGTPVRASWSPNGRVWNAGTCCGTAQRRNIDDVDHIADVIARLRPISTRVTVAGHSNGAMMATRLACERPRTASRIFALSGPLLLSRCANMRGLRVTHIHGTRDFNVPHEGGRSSLGIAQLTFPSLARSASVMRAAGAQVDVILLRGAGHSTRSLSRRLRGATGANLQQTLLQAATGN